jgi:hypothetical protein
MQQELFEVASMNPDVTVLVEGQARSDDPANCSVYLG